MLDSESRVFYDGPCRLCQQSVKWLSRRAPEIHCLPLQSDLARKFLPRELVTPPFVGVVFVDAQGDVHVGSFAIRALGAHLPQPWRWVFRHTSPWCYNGVARMRNLWGRDDSCSVL